MLSLPFELLQDILTRLSLQDISMLSLVNKECNNLCQPLLYERIVLNGKLISTLLANAELKQFCKKLEVMSVAECKMRGLTREFFDDFLQVKSIVVREELLESEVEFLQWIQGINSVGHLCGTFSVNGLHAVMNMDWKRLKQIEMVEIKANELDLLMENGILEKLARNPVRVKCKMGSFGFWEGSAQVVDWVRRCNFEFHLSINDNHWLKGVATIPLSLFTNSRNFLQLNCVGCLDSLVPWINAINFVGVYVHSMRTMTAEYLTALSLMETNDLNVLFIDQMMLPVVPPKSLRSRIVCSKLTIIEKLLYSSDLELFLSWFERVDCLQIHAERLVMDAKIAFSPLPAIRSTLYSIQSQRHCSPLDHFLQNA